MGIISWIKRNKLAAFLFVVVGYFLIRTFTNTFFGVNTFSLNVPKSPEYGDTINLNPGTASLGSPLRSGISLPPVEPDYPPQPSVQDRLVVQESNMSLLVKNVTDTRNKIVSYAQEVGGYMVTSKVSNPEDAPTSNITVRVPADKLKETLEYYRSLSVKVVSENLLGTDVTDQYVDIETRIGQLERTKVRLEEILSQATEINDITNLTQQILNYQNQIDSLKGQQEALAKNAELAKLTVYLSTDEIALPYAPSETFRPGIIFKLAVRSLVGFLRQLAAALIWASVYSVVWVPAVFLYLLVKRWRSRKLKMSPSKSSEN